MIRSAHNSFKRAKPTGTTTAPAIVHAMVIALLLTIGTSCSSDMDPANVKRESDGPPPLKQSKEAPTVDLRVENPALVSASAADSTAENLGARAGGALGNSAQSAKAPWKLSPQGEIDNRKEAIGNTFRFLKSTSAISPPRLPIESNTACLGRVTKDFKSQEPIFSHVVSLTGNKPLFLQGKIAKNAVFLVSGVKIEGIAGSPERFTPVLEGYQVIEEGTIILVRAPWNSVESDCNIQVEVNANSNNGYQLLVQPQNPRKTLPLRMIVSAPKADKQCELEGLAFSNLTLLGCEEDHCKIKLPAEHPQCPSTESLFAAEEIELLPTIIMKDMNGG